ncbi:MAG: phosphatidylserine decarboxylase [Gammaproteobacteria bacterium]
MRIAPEGRDITTVAVLATAFVWFVGGFWLALPGFVAVVFCLQFFRDPVRRCYAKEGEVLSAADGKVVFVGIATSPFDDKPALKIGVFMSPFNVHANRAPVAGKVVESKRFAGGFFNAALDKASDENERHLVVLQTAGGDNVAVMQVAGFIARRVLCHVNIGEKVAAGDRYGFIRFGSRADVYLPPEWLPETALGERVRAGISRLARAPNL